MTAQGEIGEPLARVSPTPPAGEIAFVVLSLAATAAPGLGEADQKRLAQAVVNVLEMWRHAIEAGVPRFPILTREGARPTCSTCRHWRIEAPGPRAECRMIASANAYDSPPDARALVVVHEDGGRAGAWLSTEADFGCSLHEGP